jgi:hypothetical protein
MKIPIKNQQHPPLPKKKRVDANGNDKRKLWLKEGTATMLFAKGLTENGCKALINAINSSLISMGQNALPNNKFLITR